MKKKIVCAFMVCVLSLGCLTACGGNDSDNEPQNDTATNQNDSTDADVPAADDSETQKDFVGDAYSDTGEGTFLLVNSSGTTENGNVIVVYADADTTLMQIGYETSGIKGGSLSHIYIDGMLSTKEQLGDSQGSLDLSGDSLSTGTHKVEVVQYEDDNTDDTVTMYKAASYDVKEK